MSIQNNKKKFFLGILFVFLSSTIHALPFSFHVTFPVLNVDSLERWLVHNPAPTGDRLINLIKVERSYAWVNQNKSGSFLPELMKWDSLGYGRPFKATVLYVKAVHEYLKNQHAVAYKSVMESYELFRLENDEEGNFYATCLLLQLRFDKSGDNLLIGSKLDKSYLSTVNRWVKNSKDAHSIIHAKKALFVYDNSINPSRDGYLMERESKAILDYVKNNSEIAYAQYIIQMFVSLSYHYQGRYLDSFRSNMIGLSSLSNEQIEERINILYNLSVDCLKLGKYSQSWSLNKEVLNLLYSSGSHHFSMYEGVYANLMDLAGKLGHTSKIFTYADSAVYFLKLDIQQKQANTLLALEQLYEKDKKEQKIKELEEQRQEYLIIFLIFSVFVFIIVFLAIQIYKTNQSLRNLIYLRDDFIRTLAHDLRRPMHAFTGLSDVFARLLRKGDTQSIHKIAQSIDVSGLAVRQTLDNLLYWAMDQKESLFVKPEAIPLYTHIESIRSLFAGVMALNSQVFIIRCPEDLEVMTDPNALSLILRNILDNATKHTPPDGEIRVEVCSQSAGTYIYIQDTGSGMDNSQLEIIRSLFASPKNYRTHKMSQGLGLVLVALFAQKIRIQIKVESDPNLGTKYSIGPIRSIIKNS